MALRRPWAGNSLARGEGALLARLLLAVPTLVASIRAQETRPEAPPPPRYRVLRYDEDYRYLAEPARCTDPFDPLKFIRLGAGDRFLSIGGDLRERYEIYHDRDFGTSPADHDGYVLQRYMLHADLHLGGPLGFDEEIRVFAQLKANRAADDEEGAAPGEVDDLDLHQAFLEIAAPSQAGMLTFRVGRQELAYGSQRLISVRDGPNVRRSFDAVRSIQEGDAQWRADCFAGKPVETDSGTFDDWAIDGESLWGIYATGPVVGGPSIDLYYLGLDRHDATFDQGTADELRHSIGTRAFGEGSGFDYNFEALFQWGEFGSGEIRGWTVASDTGFTLEDLPLSPRLGLKANVQSGDRDPDDSSLETFNPLYPRGKYFGETGTLGPVNLRDLHPTVRVHPTDRVTIDLGWVIYWRQSLEDGVYDNGTNLLASGSGSRERFIGSEISFTLDWALSRHVSVGAAYGHFFEGPFLQEVGLGRDIDYGSATLTFRF